jgi:cold shock CspA family protein
MKSKGYLGASKPSGSAASWVRYAEPAQVLRKKMNFFILCKHQRDDKVVWFGQRIGFGHSKSLNKEDAFYLCITIQGTAWDPDLRIRFELTASQEGAAAAHLKRYVFQGKSGFPMIKNK